MLQYIEQSKIIKFMFLKLENYIYYFFFWNKVKRITDIFINIFLYVYWETWAVGFYVGTYDEFNSFFLQNISVGSNLD